MNPTSTNQNRWLIWVAVIFAAQLALLWLWGDHRPAPAPVRSTASFHLLTKPLSDDQLAATIFASHPTLFSEPSRHGFSGSAWLHGPTQNYETPERTESPHWLELQPDRLGKSWPAAPTKRSDIPYELAGQSEPPVDLMLMNLPPEQVRTNSSVRIEGALESRQLNSSAILPAWPSSQLVNNTVIQLAVNGAGEVVSTVLLGRSGLPAADAKAMDLALNLRFRPSGTSLSGIIRGKAVFTWQTVPEMTRP